MTDAPAGRSACMNSRDRREMVERRCLRSDCRRKTPLQGQEAAALTDPADRAEGAASALIEPKAVDFAEAAIIFPRRGWVSRL